MAKKREEEKNYYTEIQSIIPIINGNNKIDNYTRVIIIIIIIIPIMVTEKP